MKKIFTFALAALFGLYAQAQTEEDVTSYVVNAGFDEDLTFQADGTRKTSEASGTTSERSNFYVAEDSTTYSLPNGTSGKTRSDGRTDAVNGFIGRIKGWTLATGSTYPTCDWVYFGSLPYTLGATTIPVADDGKGFIEVPTEKPSEDNGDDNTGVLMLRAGWDGWASYSQKVSLPCAEYRLEYWVLNTNYANSSSNTGVKNLCQVTCRKDVFADEDGFNAQNWTKHTIEFTPTSDFTITLGMQSAGGSNSNPFLWIDGIKLYKIGEADPMQIAQADLQALVDSTYQYSDINLAGYDGLNEELAAYAEAAEEAADEATTVEEIDAATKKLTEQLKKIQQAKAAADEIASMQGEIANLLNSTDYPGKSELQEAYNNSKSLLTEGNSDAIIAGEASLRAALNAYYFSQKATADSPADYTFLVSSPYFTIKSAQPSITYAADNSAVVSVEYPNAANYTLGSKPDDGNSEGWSIGNSGGDQRLNYAQNRVCWNAWRQGNTSVSINQEFTGLPNGYYTVSAEMITQPDYVTDQHVYATTSMSGTASSPALTEGNWADDGTGAWSYLTTGKVLVADGKMQIGAIGNNTASTGNQAGWFCVTNFRLLYYGAATSEEINAAYQERMKEYTSLLDSVEYKADKAGYKAVLDAFSTVNSMEEMTIALDTIASAATVAQASVQKYKDVQVGSLNDLKTRATDGTYTGSQITVANQAAAAMDDLQAAADATYTKMDSLTTLLRYYRDSYLPVVGEAEALNLTDATAKANMEATINSQISELQEIGTLATTAKLDEFIAELNKAIAVCSGAEVISTGGSDLTSMIINPSCDASSNTVLPNGWTAILEGSGNNYYTNAGQAYDGVSANRYFDAWNGTAGQLRYTIYQTLNVPNGVYELKAKMRTTGTVGAEGYYLFAYDDAKNTGIDSTAIAAVYAAAHTQATDSAYVNQNIVKGTKYGYFTDSYGPIWQEAFDAVDDNGGTAEQQAIAEANSGKGRGWFYVSLQVTVTNNKLSVGITTDSLLTVGNKDTAGNACVPFSGTWISADDFTLTLIQNNQKDYNPATGIQTIEGNSSLTAPEATYTIDGRRVANLQNAPRGIYVVSQNGKTVKVMKQ